MTLETTPASLNFSHPCHICGTDSSVIDGQRQPHACRIDLDKQRFYVPLTGRVDSTPA